MMIKIIPKVASFEEAISHIPGTALGYIVLVSSEEEAERFLRDAKAQFYQPESILIIEGYKPHEALAGISMPPETPYVISLFGIFPLSGKKLNDDIQEFFNETNDLAKMFFDNAPKNI